MASRRVLVSVAEGVARAFANRDNDVDGWWAPALLLGVTGPGDPAYRLNLLTGQTVPEGLSPMLDQLGPAWSRYFAWTLARHGVPSDRVANAGLTLRFASDGIGPGLAFGRTHRPFACTVTIRDDRGRDYIRTALSQCSPLSDFDYSRPPAEHPMRSVPQDAGRVASRVDQPAETE